MSGFVSLLENLDSLKNIYGGAVPSMEQVNFHEITIHRDGPRVLLRFDLIEFPDNPPAKWKRNGANRIQVSVLGGSVSRLNISGWERNLMLNVSVFKMEDGIVFSARGSKTTVEVCAEFWVLDKISAYMDENR